MTTVGERRGERGGTPTPKGLRTVPPALHGVRVVLIRHGEATCNLNGVVGGALGCTGLTTKGERQISALAERVRCTGELQGASAVYSSTLPRAVRTAEILAPALQDGGGPLPIVLDPDLVELRPGEADGLTWSEYVERFGQPDWDVLPAQPIAPGGESWSGFVERASSALRVLVEGAEGVDAGHEGAPREAEESGRTEAPIVVVCHAGVIEASLLRFLPVDPAVVRLRLRTTHASLTEWRYADGVWTLVRYNDATIGDGTGLSQQA